MVGFEGHNIVGNDVGMPVHPYWMLRSSGRLRDVSAVLDGGAGAGHEGSLHSSLGPSHEWTYLAKRVDYGVIRNCRSCKYIIGCDLFMCYNVDLCMY